MIDIIMIISVQLKNISKYHRITKIYYLYNIPYTYLKLLTDNKNNKYYPYDKINRIIYVR